ncbi:tetratricopeptide repeat-containing response regulator [Nitrosomonas sp.]|uniref:tetratricopeptide repeat-containing response regulator n=1 Tax=Nitrosomonas sp. TaxID=42353 RepID=UPI001DD42924|nr:tetratricopeptide repeat-containing response regulator [Nitrosomonas sp.]MCB1950092.1 response regulator [Nitrosomonas sp.]
MNIWNLKNKSVLVVDDYDKMRALMREILAPLAADKIMMARNGYEAIELLEKHTIDIVLCDYKLGNGKDGQQILEEARHRNLLNYNAVFIMITAENTSKMVMGAIDYLPDDYISKPFTPSQLQNRLEKVLNKKAKLDNIAAAINQKNYSSAIALCEQKLHESPYGQTEVLKTKGELLIKLGRLDDAEYFYQTLLKERNIPWARLALGQVYFKKSNYGDAAIQFESLMQECPDNIAAQDWLANTLEKSGEYERCQAVLEKTIQKSPKSSTRQRKLAAIALQNGAFDIAEKAYESAISEGRNSCFGNMADISGLVKSMISQEKIEEAKKAIEHIKKNYKKTDEIRLHTALASSIIHRETNESEQCKQNLDAAFKLMEMQSIELDSESALDVTQTCLAVNNLELAGKVVKQLVSNHFDNAKLLDQVKALYEKAGKLDEGEAIIERSKQEIISINNEGVKLAQEGKLEQSINFFAQAAKGMPNNATINFNAAYSMIRQMQTTGEISKYLPLSRQFLEQGHKIDPHNQKYFQLIKLAEELSSKAA